MAIEKLLESIKVKPVIVEGCYNMEITKTLFDKAPIHSDAKTIGEALTLAIKTKSEETNRDPKQVFEELAVFIISALDKANEDINGLNS